jgi:hypothetical protein
MLKNTVVAGYLIMGVLAAMPHGFAAKAGIQVDFFDTRPAFAGASFNSRGYTVSQSFTSVTALRAMLLISAYDCAACSASNTRSFRNGALRSRTPVAS